MKIDNINRVRRIESVVMTDNTTHGDSLSKSKEDSFIKTLETVENEYTDNKQVDVFPTYKKLTVNRTGTAIKRVKKPVMLLVDKSAEFEFIVEKDSELIKSDVESLLNELEIAFIVLEDQGIKMIIAYDKDLKVEDTEVGKLLVNKVADRMKLNTLGYEKAHKVAIQVIKLQDD